MRVKNRRFRRNTETEHRDGTQRNGTQRDGTERRNIEAKQKFAIFVAKIAGDNFFGPFTQCTASCTAPPRRKFSNRRCMQAGGSKTRFPVLIVTNVINPAEGRVRDSWGREPYLHKVCR